MVILPTYKSISNNTFNIISFIYLSYFYYKTPNYNLNRWIVVSSNILENNPSYTRYTQ